MSPAARAEARAGVIRVEFPCGARLELPADFHEATLARAARALLEVERC
jgi:hypothetical protein